MLSVEEQRAVDRPGYPERHSENHGHILGTVIRHATPRRLRARSVEDKVITMALEIAR